MITRRVACVFGGSGFVGRPIVRRLAERGMRVRVAVRDPVHAGFTKPMGDVGQVVPIRVDIADAAAVRAVTEGAEIVVNAVGVLVERHHAGFTLVHAVGAANIADAARAGGARALLHVSALGADPRAPSAYARSKAEGEARVRHAFPAAVILRPSLIAGPSDTFFNRFASMTSLSPFLPLIGHGRFQPVYIGDVAEAAMAAIDGTAHHGNTYSLGGPRTYTMEEMLTLMLATIGRKRRLVRIPMGVAWLQAAILQMLPSPALTTDQIRQLGTDNVVPPGAPGLAELGIAPTALEAVLPASLARYRNPYIHAFPA